MAGKKPPKSTKSHGKLRIQKIGVRHVGGRPRAIAVRHNVEAGLIGNEDGGERDAQDRAQKEALGAQAAQPEEIEERDLAGKRFAIQGLGAGGEHEQQSSRSQSAEHGLQQVARKEAGVRIRGRIAEFVQREFIGVGAERKRHADRTHQSRPAPAHIAAPHAHHDHHRQAQNQRHHDGGIDRLRQLVLGAQALIIARPPLGNLEVFAIAPWLLAEHRNLHAVLGVLQIEVALLPGEGAVGAMRPRGL